MLELSRNNLREHILKWFPERQFFHRTGGEVNFFVLGTKTQVAFAIAGVILAIWCLFTLFTVLWGQNPLRSSAKELRVQKEHYERYMVDLQAQEKSARELLVEQQEKFELAAKSFEAKHNTIVNMLKHGGIAKSDTELENMNTYAPSDVLVASVELDRVARAPIAEMADAAALNTNTNLDASFTKMEAEQDNILVSGEKNILSKIARYRAIIGETGLNVEDVLQNGRNGVGGPLIGLDGDRPGLKKGALPDRLTTMQARTLEIENLEQAMNSVPLAFPINAESYETSPYGIRKDPFTKRPTMHTGLDMASYRMAPIVATADGKASFVGRRAGYGRVVEIDHGHGFKTRYAHLAKTYVKRGQKIKKGEKIAGMGSTGRSTSTHLHYEVIFNNQTYNPKAFLKAGHYVQ